MTIGDAPRSVFVSGRYAYVVDAGSDDLKVIDVADPGAPAVVGSLGIGAEPVSVFGSGRYAYVVDFDSNDLRVIDVADPANPALAGSLGIGASPASVYVSGRHAYVAGNGSDDIQVIDVSGAEFSSAIAHSLEAGSLQVRESLVTQGQLQVTGGATIGAGGLFSDGDVGISGTIAISNDIAPSSSPDNLIQLYAEDGSGGTSELKVRDESGQITTLSPHNFSLVGGPSEPLAWSFYSENDFGRINVDMLRTVRTVERLSGEKLVHARTRDGSEIESPVESQGSLQSQVEALQQANHELRSELNRAEQRLETELTRLREELGLD